MSSVGSLVIGSESVPLGYVTPPFPTLAVDKSLYSVVDIFQFTFYWCIIMSAGFHVACAILIALSLRDMSKALVQIPLYACAGAGYGCMSGSCGGFFLGGLYIAGALKMNTWIPFIWSLITVFHLIIDAYYNSSAYM